MKGISTEDALMIIESLENSLEIYEQTVVDYKDWNETKEDGFQKFNQEECDKNIEFYKNKVSIAKSSLETARTWV